MPCAAALNSTHEKVNKRWCQVWFGAEFRLSVNISCCVGSSFWLRSVELQFPSSARRFTIVGFVMTSGTMSSLLITSCFCSACLWFHWFWCSCLVFVEITEGYYGICAGLVFRMPCLKWFPQSIPALPGWPVKSYASVVAGWL